jgi:(2Fe-2S) ferredoxin
MTPNMPTIPRPAFYIFKCEQSSPPYFPKPSCVNEQTKELFNYTAQSLMQKGIMQTVQPIRTSCLNRCQHGPIMLIEPGNHMYVNLDKDKIDRIIDEHLIGGSVIEEYLLPKEFWGDPVNPKDLATK